MTGFEVALAVGLSAAILGFAAAVTAWSWVWYPRWRRAEDNKLYPHVVPGSGGMRVSASPVATITVDDVARGLTMFIDRAVSKGYDRCELEARFARVTMQFVRAVNDDGERYVVDGFGRKIAGDTDGTRMRVVVLDGDGWENTAGFHEFGHGAHATRGRVDYGHRDDVMWHEIVGWCKKAFRD